MITRLAHFCALSRKQVPRAQAIFVAQAGRKFRLFSSTVQRYKNFKAFPNYIAKKARKKTRFEKTSIKSCILAFLHQKKETQLP